MPHYTHLRVHRLQDVLFVTLNSPATRHALSPEMTAELYQVSTLIQADLSLRAVVLRGSQGFFCAGGNIGSFQSRLDAHVQSAPQQIQDLKQDPIAARNREFGKFLELWSALPVPIIAVVEGAAMGGGMGLACTADVVLATEGAKFGLTETTLGIIPAQIAPFVRARIGRRNALRLGMFGEQVSGPQAVALGLVDELAADSQALDERLAHWLTRMCRCAPRANQALKHLFRGNDGVAAASLSQTLDAAARSFSDCMRDEGPEGIAAFKERRSARWQVTFDAEQIRHALNSDAATPLPPSP
ncbi:2,3-dehydroadipyl-CoA hydratase [bioreactor metagenome]|uniref:2,3-dehydroadipyl-CoA hydratase n=1 Tax=bioreactor metagenome TaxID=1076179 RepID=A0A644YRT0_9ZZZZ